MKTRSLLFLFSLWLVNGYALAQNDTILENQPAFYKCTDPIKIDSNPIEIRLNEVYFQFETDKTMDELKSLDVKWFKNLPNDYFPAYFINTTDTVFNATRQDGSLIMIQEARNENGDWTPIEYWVHSGCGNSYFDPLKLTSGSFAIIPIKKYSGNFETTFRLKLRANSNVYYSDTFEGSIEKSQFEKVTRLVHGILYHGAAKYLDD